MFLYLLLLQYALALLDLYSQVSLSLQNPTPSRLKSQEYGSCFFLLLLCMQRSMLDPVCNVPDSGESRETKDWPPAILMEAQK